MTTFKTTTLWCDGTNHGSACRSFFDCDSPRKRVARRAAHARGWKTVASPHRDLCPTHAASS